MFAMMGIGKRSSFALVNADAAVARLVPALLRNLARFAARLASGNVNVPRHAGVIGLVALFSATGAYGMIEGGHTQVVIKQATSTLGFAISEIKVAGHKETSEIDVLQTLELDGITSLIGFDSEAARQRILAMPWIANAQVTKLYPDGVSVLVTEKQPFAVWQHQDALSLIDSNGDPIVAFSDEKYLGLPLLIGEGANRHGQALLALMTDFPSLAARVKAYVRVGSRRWDIVLDDGVKVQLPENELETALSEAVSLEQDHGLLARDVESVDLRLNDRIVVRLTPDGQSLRDATLKENQTRKKKSEAQT